MTMIKSSQESKVLLFNNLDKLFKTVLRHCW